MCDENNPLIEVIRYKLSQSINQALLLHIELSNDYTLPIQLQRQLDNAYLIDGEDYTLLVDVDEIAPGKLPTLCTPSLTYIIDNVELIETSSLVQNLSRIAQAGGAAIIFGQIDADVTHELAEELSIIN